MTLATSALMLPARHARVIALMLLPRPEMRIAMRNGAGRLIR
jgi:hypothetical protein